MSERMPDAERISSVLREQRKKLGITQRQCAERAKIAERQYQYFENGERNLMTCSFEIACRVIRALELDPTGFFHDKLVSLDFQQDKGSDIPAKELLRDRRISLGLTLKQTAERAGIVLQQYQKYELGRGDLRRAAYYTACRVIEALEMDITAFFHGRIEPMKMDRF